MLLLVSSSHTLLSNFAGGGHNQRYPDVACDFRIFLLPVLRLLISRNVRELDWYFEFNEPKAFLTKLMTFLTSVIGKFMEGDPSGLWHSRTSWVPNRICHQLSLEQSGFLQEQSLSTLEQSHKIHFCLLNTVKKSAQKTVAYLKEILKDFQFTLGITGFHVYSGNNLLHSFLT